ncbi:MAG: transglycosylase domain-containing protein, partial [Kangiellaceae bacterium]|nr:transglycosylase domain-containing protein [Kangiellaceae bacterium]
MKYLPKPLLSGIYYVFLLLLAAFMGFTSIYLYLGPNLPNVDSIREIKLQTPMTVFTSDGELIAEFGDKRRIPVTLDEVPEQFINALIATEDKRFYEHSGVDFWGVIRAIITNVTTGSRSQGASTLTQLVARNVYLDRKKTFTRKIREMFLAWKIESEISKDEILELFLNKAHFSHRAYGLGAAAQVYYGKELDQLALDELAVLAGIPKGESIFNPISNPANALKRRNHVLGRMLAEGYISQLQYDEAKAQPVNSKKHGAEVTASAPYLAEMVRRDLIDRYGREAAYNNGYRVYTTIDSKLQHAAQQALKRSLLDYDKRHGYRGPLANVDLAEYDSEQKQVDLLSRYPIVDGLANALVIDLADKTAIVRLTNGETMEISWDGLKWAAKFISSDRRSKSPRSTAEILQLGDVVQLSEMANQQWRLSQTPEASAAFVALKPNDGAIAALVGGYDFSLNQFNMVTQARRQPGSNIKPFIYSAALSKGYTAASVLNDSPVVKEDATAEEAWRPKNDSGNYKGPTRLREALKSSTNMISIRLMNAISPTFAEQYLAEIGFPDEHMTPYASLALGSANFTPMEVVTGYAVFANGGYKVAPYFIQRIESANEDVLFKSEPVEVCLPCEQLATSDDMPNLANQELQEATLETLPASIEQQDPLQMPLLAEPQWPV